LVEDQNEVILRKLRFDETRNQTNKENMSPYRYSKSKSAHKKNFNLTKTPRMKKQISAFEYTPERFSAWRG
jgi:hypothetical protein